MEELWPEMEDEERRKERKKKTKKKKKKEGREIENRVEEGKREIFF